MERRFLGVPYSPNYQILGQISYTVGVTQTERKHYHTTADVNVVDRKFVISKAIKFKVGKAELEPESTELLDQIAEVIQKNHVKRLLISGHTDSTHTEQFNLKLSGDRAVTVKNYLVAKGIPEEGLIPKATASESPKLRMPPKKAAKKIAELNSLSSNKSYRFGPVVDCVEVPGE